MASLAQKCCLHGQSLRGPACKGLNGNPAHALGGPMKPPCHRIGFTLCCWGKALATSPCVGNSVNLEGPGRLGIGSAQAQLGPSEFPASLTQGDRASPFPQGRTLCSAPPIQPSKAPPSLPCSTVHMHARWGPAGPSQAL